MTNTLTRRCCLGVFGAALASIPAACRANEEGVGVTTAVATAPDRIAAPDRAAAQTLLALGVVPVASVSNSFYEAMGATPPLPANVVGCGSPTEPNIELLEQLKVDLIVTGTINADVRDVLRRVAPVFALDIYTGGEDTLGRAQRETLRLASCLRLENAGQNYLARLNASLESGTQRLRGRRFPPVFLVALAGDGRHMTVYGRNSLMYDVMAGLNVVNAWHGPTNNFGFCNTGIERLAVEPDAVIILIDYGATTDAALEELAGSPFWTNLPMVRAGRIYRMRLFDVFGALPAAELFATHFVDALISQEVANG